MTKRNENRLTMYEGLMTLMQANKGRVQSIAGFSTALEDFTALVDSIKAKSSEVQTVSAGKTDVKYNAQEILIEVLLPVVSGLYVYGRKHENPEIQALTNVTEYKLRRKRDTDLVQFSNTVVDLGQTNMKKLAPYGITVQKMEELKAKAAAYNSAIGMRESSIAERKGGAGKLERSVRHSG